MKPRELRARAGGGGGGKKRRRKRRGENTEGERGGWKERERERALFEFDFMPRQRNFVAWYQRVRLRYPFWPRRKEGKHSVVDEWPLIFRK